MSARGEHELPKSLQPVYERAKRLEWITIGFLVSAVVVVLLTMGSSQAMKAAWIEDLLSLVPPVAFLISSRFRDRSPSERFPYGYHRAVSIAFLAGSFALSMFGAFILIDSVISLAGKHHPSIGTMVLFGHGVWAGWVMIAALAYSAIPPLVLGRMKQQPARELHDKTLMADSDMNRADWLTACAGIAGILGIGIGWWWADSVAAGIISIDILIDGVKNLRRVVADLMDRVPTTVDGEQSDVPERVRGALLGLEWIRECELRMREEGHVFTGEAFIKVTNTESMPAKLAEARGVAHAVDWRVHDLVFEVEDVLPMAALDDLPVPAVDPRS